MTESDCDRLRAAANLELAENVLDVGGNRLRGYHKLSGDLILRMTFCEEVQDFVLTLRQRIEPVGRALFQRDFKAMRVRGLEPPRA